MIFSSNKMIKIIKKNIEIIFLFLLLLITILSTTIYNEKKIFIDENYKNLINNIYFQKSINKTFDNLVPRYKNIDHKISSGETFDKILNNYSIPNEEINQIKKNLNSDYDINNLKPNLEIKITIDQSNNKKIIFKEGKITQSLYKTAIDLNVQPNVIIEFARIYGFQVDFQRDIRKNDNFQIMYEVFEDDDGKVFETGNIIFADLKLSGKNNELYYFEKKGSEGHYDENGKSVEKALMKTPINGARLSSAFGMRKHPIDGFNKMHRGTDFAAPMGTPIMASGSGLITRARWCGGGGNCIKIKHNSTYETIYAHMKNFARGIKEGIRVKQGQIIGYVGSTGKSTGPHLHYEVVVNGKKVNSQKLKLPSGKTLKGKERKIFEVEKIKLDVLKSELIIG